MIWESPKSHVFLEQRRAERLRHAAFDLAAALHRVDDGAGVGGLHAFENADFAADAVHRHAEALHVEGDRARHAVAVAAARKARRRPRRPRGVAPQARCVCRRKSRPPGQRAAFARRAAVAGGESRGSCRAAPPPPVRWRGRRPRCRCCRRRRCRGRHARCRIASAVWSPPRSRSALAAICRCTVVVPLPNSAVPTVSA